MLRNVGKQASEWREVEKLSRNFRVAAEICFKLVQIVAAFMRYAPNPRGSSWHTWPWAPQPHTRWILLQWSLDQHGPATNAFNCNLFSFAKRSGMSSGHPHPPTAWDMQDMVEPEWQNRWDTPIGLHGYRIPVMSFLLLPGLESFWATIHDLQRCCVFQWHDLYLLWAFAMRGLPKGSQTGQAKKGEMAIIQKVWFARHNASKEQRQLSPAHHFLYIQNWCLFS